jgi:hypothetical protein
VSLMTISPLPGLLIERQYAPDRLTLYMEHPSTTPASIYDIWEDTTGYTSELDMGGSIVTRHFPTPDAANTAVAAIIDRFMNTPSQALPA